ncbi:MAG: alpha/beta hydrolase [Planctomycetales bacterium]
MNRRSVLVAVGTVLSLWVASIPLRAEDPPVRTQKTYVYKTVGETKIQLDFSRPHDQSVRPLVVWIHGGALIMGGREGIPRELKKLCNDQGFALASLDYRLAPEVKLPAIIEDIRDAFQWLRDNAGKELHINPDRMGVVGGSAGGYLTMMTGIILSPPPTVLMTYFGYGDVDGDWYTKPWEPYRKGNLVSEEKARAGVGQFGVLTNTDKTTGKGRGDYYMYLRQNGLWTKEVTGFDPSQKSKLDPYCPVRNITSKYPPILMIHGTADTDVPYVLSANMDAELTKHNCPHEFITIEKWNHGFGKEADQTLVESARNRAMEYIRVHLVK